MLFQLALASFSVRIKWKDFERNGKILNEMERFRIKWKDFERNVKISNEMERF